MCPMCQEVLHVGVQHICPVLAAQHAAAVAPAAEGSEGGLKGFLWKIFAGIVVALVLQLGGAIWWASRVQNTLDNFKDQLAAQQQTFKEQIEKQAQTIERIDSYFRRPPPAQ